MLVFLCCNFFLCDSFVPHDTSLTSASFLGIDLAGTALRCLGRGLALSGLFVLFRGRARTCVVARSSRWLPLCRPRSRLLNYDIVLNVELVVHIHDVDLNTLTTRSTLGMILRLGWSPSIARAATGLHIRRNNSLHMEKLLIVLPTLLVLHALPTISLMLDVLGWMRATHCATNPSISSASWLRWCLVVTLEHLLLVV